MEKTFNKHITCAFLYSITRYGYPPAAENMPQYIHEMADLGFQSIEIEGIGENHLKTVYQKRHDIKKALNERDIHLPVFCTVLPGIASPNKKIAQKNMDLFEIGCELTAYWGAKGILDNGPLVPYEFPSNMPIHRHYSPEVLINVSLSKSLSWEAYWEGVIYQMDAACELAAKYNLNYYLHPCMGSLTDTTDSYLLLKRQVNRPNMKFNFDTANLYYMHENLSLGLLKLGNELDYIHISDNCGQKIEHQALGNGQIEWDLFFTTLKQIDFSGNLSIDVGGDESHIEDINNAYIQTAYSLEEKITTYEIY
ncbi:sugar phosphate isomerase/epimerase family protein [Bacteroides sp.]